MSAGSGQCQCGAVSFTAKEVEREFGACHCRMCQRLSGGIFLAATARGVEFSGSENLTRYQSSGWAERGFCSQCGSNIFYRIMHSEEYEICLGALDEVTDFVLTSEIFVDRKPAGYALAGDHPRLSEAETLARFREFTE